MTSSLVWIAAVGSLLLVGCLSSPNLEQAEGEDRHASLAGGPFQVLEILYLVEPERAFTYQLRIAFGADVRPTFTADAMGLSPCRSSEVRTYPFAFVSPIADPSRMSARVTVMGQGDGTTERVAVVPTPGMSGDYVLTGQQPPGEALGNQTLVGRILYVFGGQPDPSMHWTFEANGTRAIAVSQDSGAFEAWLEDFSTDASLQVGGTSYAQSGTLRRHVGAPGGHVFVSYGIPAGPEEVAGRGQGLVTRPDGVTIPVDGAMEPQWGVLPGEWLFQFDQVAMQVAQPLVVGAAWGAADCGLLEPSAG